MKIIKNILIISVLLCIAAAIVYFFAISSAKPQIPNGSLVSVQEAKESVDAKEGVILVDVRRPDEYKNGHLKNSILVTLDTISEKAPRMIPDKDQRYYIYCRTGKRSGQAVKMLQQMGYSDVHSVDGGIVAWTGAGFPTEK